MIPTLFLSTHTLNNAWHIVSRIFMHTQDIPITQIYLNMWPHYTLFTTHDRVAVKIATKACAPHTTQPLITENCILYDFLLCSSVHRTHSGAHW